MCLFRISATILNSVDIFFVTSLKSRSGAGARVLRADSDNAPCTDSSGSFFCYFLFVRCERWMYCFLTGMSTDYDKS